ncbi:MAG: hypothetical protein KAS58_02130, partial [Calditrichia bacterium]|nr:hypothetical protein [Calditrichia bacterium]
FLSASFIFNFFFHEDIFKSSCKDLCTCLPCFIGKMKLLLDNCKDAYGMTISEKLRFFQFDETIIKPALFDFFDL